MTLLLKIAAIGGILLALASTYPGVLEDLIFVGILLSPLWLLGGLVLLCFANFTAKEAKVGPDLRADDEVGVPERVASRRNWSLICPAILALSFASILADIPMRLGFLLSLPSFERAIFSERPAIEIEDSLFGVYHVDRFGQDSRGGAYFRTHAGPDGIGPDTMSHGFAYRPDPQRTPFGSAHYRITHTIRTQSRTKANRRLLRLAPLFTS